MTTTINRQNIIDTNNARFNAVDNAGKRVLICTDALERLRNSQYMADTGNWIKIDKIDPQCFSQDSLRDIVVDNKITCEVCAAGSILLSMVVFKNHYKPLDISIGDLGNYHLLHTGTSKDEMDFFGLFTKIQVEMIDAAYELGEGFFKISRSQLSKYTFRQCVAFGSVSYTHLTLPTNREV